MFCLSWTKLARKCITSHAVRKFSQFALISEENGVRTITLNHPKKRNALSSSMIEHLTEGILKNLEDVSTRCILIKSTGPVFSSGHDLKELKESSPEKQQEIFQKCSDLMLGIRAAPVPVIAEVKGLAAAAGCQLIASCDIVIASQNARFSTPGASVGLFCSTPGIAVSRTVPLKVSAYMLFTGDTISAEEALQSGLVSKVATEDKIDAVTDHVIKAILMKSRSVIELGKKFFYMQLEKDIASSYRDGTNVMVDNLSKTDCQEGITAFFEKRAPKWSHT